MREPLRDQNKLTEKEFLAQYRAKDYERPSVTADILLFAREAAGIKLLLIRRAQHPCLGCWALPGGFANPDESVDQAAARELYEETHIEGLPLVQLGMFSNPGRDVRGWVITQAYLSVCSRADIHALAGDDAADVRWFSAFCHLEGENACLRLLADGVTLSATLKLHSRETPCGWMHDIQLMENDGLAFDHAKIILRGLMRLQEGR